jgi:hypothetical protein
LSDLLGNHNVLLAGQVNGSFSDALFFAGYHNLRQRYNWGVSAQQIPLYRLWAAGQGWLGESGQERPVLAYVLQRDLYRSAHGVVSYPFSTFRRVELGMSANWFRSDVLFQGQYLDTGEVLNQEERLWEMDFLQPSAALVFDNSLFGWTGPIYGRRYRVSVSRPLGDISFTEAMVDFRNYINIRQHLVFAARLTALVRQGEDGDRFPFYWGGPYFLRGYDANSFRFDSAECQADVSEVSACPALEQLIGSSAAIMNLEVRFPFIRELRLGPLGQFPPVDALVFFDGGVAWSDRVCVGGRTGAPGVQDCPPDRSRDVRLTWRRDDGDDPMLVRQPLFSYGAGIRFNIFYAVLRFDYAMPLNRPGGGVFSFSVGPSF